MDVKKVIAELQTPPKAETIDPAPLVPKYREAFLKRGYDDKFGNLDAIASYAASYRAGTAKKGLCLIGKCGTGKTLAMRIFNELFTKRTWLVAVDQIMHEIDGNSDEIIQKYGDAKKEDWQGNIWDGRSYFKADLIIDDIGSEHLMVDYGKRFEIVSQLLTWRDRMHVDRIAMTFLTSNLSLPMMEKRYDKRIKSRIEGMCHVVVMNGDDRRSKP